MSLDKATEASTCESIYISLWISFFLEVLMKNSDFVYVFSIGGEAYGNLGVFLKK